MAKQHKIDVYFHNLWGGGIEDVTLKFSTNKSSIEEEVYTKDRIAPGEKWGPLKRKYETGPGSEDFDFWHVEFKSAGEPGGRFRGRTKFACVIDTDVPPDSHLDLWVSGKERVFYTGYPDNVGGKPGVSGYSGYPKESPGGDYTCQTKLENT